MGQLDRLRRFLSTMARLAASSFLRTFGRVRAICCSFDIVECIGIVFTVVRIGGSGLSHRLSGQTEVVELISICGRQGIARFGGCGLFNGWIFGTMSFLNTVSSGHNATSAGRAA
jgi:hypothetical protein